MAIRSVCGFETGTLGEAGSTAGTVSIVSSGQRTGNYALRVSPTAANTGIAVLGTPSATTGQHNIGQNLGSDLFIGFAFKAVTLPASAEEEFVNIDAQAYLRITSGGIIKLYATDGTTLVATGSTALTAGVWYYIELKVTVGTTQPYELRINGVTEFSGNATVDSVATSWSSVTLGKETNRNSQTVDFYYDDFYIDDSTFRATSSAIPEVRRIGPNGAGDSAGWTNGTGSTFAEVDEVPPESDGTDASYIQASATQDGLYTTLALQSCADVGITGTILAVMLDAWTKTGSTSGSSLVGTRLRNGSTNVDGPQAEWLASYSSKRQVRETDPNGGGAWTSGGVDTLQAGCVAGAITQTQRMSAVCVHVLALVSPPEEVDVDGSQPAATGEVEAITLPGDRQVGGTAATSTSITWSHTVAGASNRVLYVFIDAFSGGGDPTSVVFNGSEALTEIADFLGGGSNDNNCSVWRLINPTATTANIVASFSESGDLTGASVSYSGVDQTTPNDTVQELDSTSQDPTHNITSEGGDRVVSCWMGWGLGTIAAIGGLTERYEDNNTNTINSIAIGDGVGAALVAASWDGASVTDPHGVFSFNLNRATVGGPVLVDVDGDQPAASGRLLVSALPLKGAQPTGTGALTVRRVFSSISLAGAQPSATGRVRVSALRLVGSQPTATGSIAARVTLRHVSLAGDQPSATGTLIKALFELLSGAQPEATGALALRRLLSHVALAGDDPAASGRLLVSALRLAGAQPFATGTLVADEVLQHVALAGDQPTAIGELAFEFIGAEEVDVAGNQPTATGTIARQLFLHISLAGAQPTGTGEIAVRRPLTHISLAGDQPTATGALAFEFIGATEIDVAGDQPAATGTLTTQLDVLIHDSLGAWTRAYPRIGVWLDDQVGYVYCIEPGGFGNQLIVEKTTDAGRTWTVLHTVVGGGFDNVLSFQIWADWWTSGNTGTLIHCWWIDSFFDVVDYRALDTADDSQGTPQNVLGGSGLTGTRWHSGTVSRDGNLAVFVDDAGTLTESLLTSDDGGATWDVRANPGEGSADQYHLLPANLADPRDLWLVFWDESANELTLKTYDDSADSWSESSAFATSMFESSTPQSSAAVRWSDGHAIFAAWSQFSATTSDYRVFDIDGAGSITELTSPFTDTDTAFGASVQIDQNTDDIYVWYVRGASDAAVNVYYKVSSDGGASWGSEVQYSQDPPRNSYRMWTDHGSYSFRVAAWFPDETNSDLWFNANRSIGIEGSPRLAGEQLAASGTLAVQRPLTHVSLAGDQPSASGRLYVSAITLRGSQPAATGTIAAVSAQFEDLSGAQPAAAGSLTFRRTLSHVSLAGSQPEASGRLRVSALRLSGSQAAASGDITALQYKALAGAQPPATGTIAASQVLARSLAGNQPAATGTIAAQSFRGAILAGAQPAASGTLSVRLVLVHVTLTGVQPSASGVVVGRNQADAPGSAAMEDTLVYLAIMSDTLSASATMTHELVSRAELVDSAAGAETDHELVYAGTMQESRP